MDIKESSIYRFFTGQIYKTESEIRTNRFKLVALSKTQTELKRGRTYLYKLRREYVESMKAEEAGTVIAKKREELESTIQKEWNTARKVRPLKRPEL